MAGLTRRRAGAVLAACLLAACLPARQPVAAEAPPADAADTRLWLRTASGSVYLVQPDGTTVWHKAAQGRGGSGWHARSALTVYVDPAMTENLLGAAGPEAIWLVDPDAGSVTRSRLTPDRRKAIPSQAGWDIAFRTAPATGLAPMQFWAPGPLPHSFTEVAVGHAIVTISSTPIAAAR